MKIKNKGVIVLCWLCVIFLFPATVYSISPEEFDSVVDFSVTIKELHSSLTEAGKIALDPDKFIIINGSVLSIQIYDKSEQEFAASVELVLGEWDGLEDVHIYKCVVIFQGPSFYPVIPSRTPREPVPGVVLKNSRVIVVAKLFEPYIDQMEEPVWYLEGLYIRPIG